jgi:membrane-bound lytic murein transglycosylase A
MKYVFAFSMLLLCSGCALFAPKDRFGAREITFEELSGWADDDHSEAVRTFIPSCEVFARKPRAATSGSDIEIPQDVWQSLCDEAKWSQDNPLQARLFFEQRFVPFRINNRDKETGLFTGYYEPVLYGSRRKSGDFKYPVYAMPPDLQGNKPYLDRREIDEGALSGRGLEIIWVDDPVMLFFLHIQGSGRARLSRGEQIQLGYADGNGQPYVSLGKIMGDEGLIPKDQINFFTIRQWLYDHPQQAMEMMQRNPSYIFLKELNKLGAVGAAAVQLTPKRSLAVDSKYIPYGLPLFLETELPAQDGLPAPFHRLVIAQDTGGAIRSPVRGDIFFGMGDEAEFLAGNMKGRGVYSLLVPKEIADQLRE